MGTDRYEVSGLLEAQFEPGSDEKVLRNLRGITVRDEMDMLEAAEYAKTFDFLVGHFEADQRFSAADICFMHKTWLGSIYSWAGSYRNVNVSKSGFTFAAAKFVPGLMSQFERDILARYSPCTFPSMDEVVEALAIVHTEFILIHPFREGNGRTGRLLSSLMALQAGLPGLDFGGISHEKREEYFAAIRIGMNSDYEPMKRIFSEIISTASVP